MSFSVELPPDIEQELRAIPDIKERLANFLRGQAELEQLRKNCYSEGTVDLTHRDAMGYPEGYFEATAGSFANELPERAEDLPPQLGDR